MKIISLTGQPRARSRKTPAFGDWKNRVGLFPGGIYWKVTFFWIFPGPFGLFRIPKEEPRQKQFPFFLFGRIPGNFRGKRPGAGVGKGKRPTGLGWGWALGNLTFPFWDSLAFPLDFINFNYRGFGFPTGGIGSGGKEFFPGKFPFPD